MKMNTKEKLAIVFVIALLLAIGTTFLPFVLSQIDGAFEFLLPAAMITAILAEVLRGTVLGGTLGVVVTAVCLLTTVYALVIFGASRVCTSVRKAMHNNRVDDIDANAPNPHS